MTDEKQQLEELWTRFVAAEALGPEERATLTAGLERDEVFRRRMVHDLQIHGMLRAAGELESGQEAMVAEVKALLLAGRRLEAAGVADSGPGRTADGRAADLLRHRRGERSPGRAQTHTSGAHPSEGGRESRDGKRVLRSGRVLAGGVVLAAVAAGWVVFSRPAVSPDPSAPEPGRHATDHQQGEGRGPQTSPPARTTGFFSRRPPREPTRGAPLVLARVEAIQGRTVRHGADGEVRAGRVLEIQPGDWVTTSGENARARLLGPGGSELELLGDVVAGLAEEEGQPRSARLFLAHGRVIASVPARRPGAMLVLASPHAIVLAQGTVRLQVGGAETRVEVKEGRAQVSGIGVQQGTDVVAGQLALVSADELKVPLAEGLSREVLLLTGPDNTKEEPPPPDGLRGSEEALKARLERLGFNVSAIDAGALVPERARTAVLLVLSPSVSTRGLPAGFAELPVPMLVLESTGFEQLGLTGKRWRRDVGSVPPQTEIAIVNPKHPLAGGLSETVQVLAWPLGLRWATPPPSASVVATYLGAPERAALFGYERGAPTASGTAPARRVGLFFGNGRVIRALTEPGWRLFDAAALWATES